MRRQVEVSKPNPFYQRKTKTMKLEVVATPPVGLAPAPCQRIKFRRHRPRCPHATHTKQRRAHYTNPPPSASAIAARAAPYEKGTETQELRILCRVFVQPRARPPMRRGLKRGAGWRRGARRRCRARGPL